MNNIIGKVQNQSLDFFKFFACLGVVCIHSPLPDKLCVPGATFGKIGVPFFLMISGYYLSSNLEIKSDNIIRKIKHILQIALEAVSIYLVFRVLFEVFVKGTLWSDAFFLFLQPQKWIDFLCTNSPIYYAHLWFLFALVYCYLLVLLLKSNWNGRWKVGYIIIALTLFLFSSELGRFLHIPFQIGFFIPFNLFFFRALPFFMIGYLFKEYQDYWSRLYNKIGSSRLLAIIFLFYVISLIEAKIFHSSQFYAGTIISTTSIFLWCLNNPSSLRGEISAMGRYLSIYIYIYHVAIFQVLKFAFGGTDADTFEGKWGVPFFTIVLSVIFAYIRYTIKRRP